MPPGDHREYPGKQRRGVRFQRGGSAMVAALPARMGPLCGRRAGPATMSERPTPREIPFNYTSADDRQAIAQLLGPAVWQRLEELRTRRVTGRSARLLARFFGEILIHRRNP